VFLTIVEELVKKGADKEVTNYGGDKPVDLVQSKVEQHKDAVERGRAGFESSIKQREQCEV
jgi:hypothetical protein